jgi:hypothetical protein
MRTVGPAGDAERRVIEITDVHLETFDWFVKWLEDSTPVDPRRCLARQNPLYLSYHLSASGWLLMLRIYIFSDKYGISLLRDRALHQISEFAEYMKVVLRQRTFLRGAYLSLRVRPSHIIHVYNTPPVHSPLRTILVDLFCSIEPLYTSSPEELRQYPKDFLIDVMIRRASAARAEQEQVDELANKRKRQN